MNTEKHEQFHLDNYIENGRRGNYYGVSAIQRTCKIGYNLAAYVAERGVKQGVLEVDPDCEFKYKIVDGV